eukprot:11194279-Alexandrium_andersonii.AAC.1
MSAVWRKRAKSIAFSLKYKMLNDNGTGTLLATMAALALSMRPAPHCLRLVTNAVKPSTKAF